jgi:hypothetical protein
VTLLCTVMVTHFVSKQGVVDLDAEIVKNEKKIAFAKMGMEKVQKQIDAPTYMEKTPEAVRQRNDEKVRFLANTFCSGNADENKTKTKNNQFANDIAQGVGSRDRRSSTRRRAFCPAQGVNEEFPKDPAIPLPFTWQT